MLHAICCFTDEAEICVLSHSNVILGLRFLKVGDVETGEVEKVDGHGAALKIKRRRESWMGELDFRQEFRTSRAAARSY